MAYFLHTPYSYTKIEKYRFCPYAFKLKYIDHAPETLTKEQKREYAFGNLFHLFVEKEGNLEEIKMSKKLKTLLQDLAKEDVKTAQRLFKKYKESKFYEYFEEEIETLQREYPFNIRFKEDEKGIVRCSLEKFEFLQSFKDSMGHFRGVIDTLKVDEKRKIVYALDYKTVESDVYDSLPTQKELKNLIVKDKRKYIEIFTQIYIYSVIVKAIVGNNYKVQGVYLYFDYKNARIKALKQSLKEMQIAFGGSLEKLCKTIGAIEASDYYPKKEKADEKCKKCSYYETCFGTYSGN